MSTLARLSILFLLLPQFMVACGPDARSAPSGEDPFEGIAATDGGSVARVAADGEAPRGCSEGMEGCPCETPGATAFCGWIKRTSGSYVACSPGEATCTDDLTWGSCVGDQVAHSVKKDKKHPD